MREVKPTQKPVPSSDIKDLFFNSGLLDIWATSLEHKYIDRFGNCHLTAAGMEWLFKELVETFKVDMNTAIVAAGYITIDSFQQGADLPNNELTQRNHILRDETTGEYYRWDGDLPKQVPAGSTPQSTGGIGEGAWVSVGDASLRSDLSNNNGANLIKEESGGTVQDALNAPCIYVYKYIKNGEIDSTDILQELQNKSEVEKKPLNFVGVKKVTIASNIYYKTYLNWYSTSYSDTSIYFTNNNRDEVNVKFIYKLDETVSSICTRIADMHIDFGNKSSGMIPIPELIQGICVVARGVGAHDGNIDMLRCKFTNPRGDCLRVQTWDGGRASNVNMVDCIGDVDSLSTASLRANMFRTFNGEEHAPGQYGIYTINDVSLVGGSCRGFRSMSDFKRGTSNIYINDTYTEDTTDCHHSADGVKGYTFGAGNRGKATKSQTQAVKNYLEVQGEDVVIEDGALEIDDDVVLEMTGGYLITQYAYPAEEAIKPNIAHPSRNVKIKGGTFNKINNHSVRLINTYDSEVRGIVSNETTWDAVSFELVNGKIDINGNPIYPQRNFCDDVKIKQGRSCVTTLHAGLTLGPNMQDEHGQYSIYNYRGTFKYSFIADDLNSNTYLIDYNNGTSPLMWSKTTANFALYSIIGDIPDGEPYAVSLEDNSSSFLMIRNYARRIPVSTHDIFYFKTMMKSITGTPQAAIIVRLYKSDGALIKAEFIALNLTSQWEKYYRAFKIELADVAFMEIAISPGSYDNSPTKMGKIGVSGFSFSRKPL
ncbi:hypothetical protein [Providencia sp. PROV108]|uniref:tail fiber/spike domain-containing protein n=1 Tax=Providencia sp. PROV108 TaxID=2949820 RepID=UPI002348F405|nr:hypothetical protein [Providencia sp. PROV108]